MAQTPEGAIKVAAQHIGVTAEEYVRLVAAGQKWCMVCKRWQPVGEFGKDRSRVDGLASGCREGRNTSSRDRYVSRPPPVPGRAYVESRDGDKLQARGRVNHLVRVGILPDPNDVPCVDCGHVWTEGERRHEYDHHRGYEAGHHEDVEAVCSRCHHRRARERGEVRQRGERGR